jgi:hypothetical protein
MLAASFEQMKDYYKILCVNVDSTTEDIKKAFRQKALKIHPDKSGSDTSDEFIELFEAYNILVDQKRKTRYDLIYDWINQEGNNESRQKETEFEKDVLMIHSQGMAYARDFKQFDRDVLKKILWDLLFVFDRLVFACTAATFVGIATIIKGLSNLDIEYSFVGIVISCIGLFIGKLKIEDLKYQEKMYEDYRKSSSKEKASR